MNPVPQTLLTDSMAPMVIWIMLMVAAVPAVILLASPQAVHRPGRMVMTVVELLRCHREAREQARREAAAAKRLAEQARVVAAHANVTVQHRQQYWCEAVQRTDDAWLTWQAAEQQVTRGRAAAAFAPPWAARTTTEQIARTRFLHRSVSDAVRRGDLPPAALTSALAGRDGWNPWLHPVEQEVVILRTIADYRQHCHRLATVAERAAWHDIQHAATIHDRLRGEALAAAQRATRRRLRPAVEHWTIPALRLTWHHRLA